MMQFPILPQWPRRCGGTYRPFLMWYSYLLFFYRIPWILEREFSLSAAKLLPSGRIYQQAIRINPRNWRGHLGSKKTTSQSKYAKIWFKIIRNEQSFEINCLFSCNYWSWLFLHWRVLTLSENKRWYQETCRTLQPS